MILQLEKCSHTYHKLCLVAMYNSGPKVCVNQHNLPYLYNLFHHTYSTLPPLFFERRACTGICIVSFLSVKDYNGVSVFITRCLFILK